MKKQKTILIIVLIVAIATAGVYLAVGLVGEQKEQTGDNVNTIVMLTQRPRTHGNAKKMKILY